MANVTTVRRRRGRKSLLTGFDASIEEQTALDQYLRDVSRHELITPDKEKELGALAQLGDEGAIQELARANLRFVISVAKKYQNRGVSLTDLIQEGNVGLVTAARKFDPEQGVKFISYAVWWIRQAILASLANHGRAVRVPLNRASDLARIFREKERLKQELGRDPTSEELSVATDLTPERRLDHVPYALNKSVLEEVWKRFPDHLERLSAQPFRHPDSVSLTYSLAPHYGICTGTAVAVSEPYSTYIKVKRRCGSSLILIARLLWQMFKRSSRTKFLSVNDSGELDDGWLTEAAIALFFRVTYPRKSRFERNRRLLAPMAFPPPGRSTR